MSIKPIKQKKTVSKTDVQKALADPSLKPIIQAALKASGLTIDSLPNQKLGIWSKTYTETTSGIAPLDRISSINRKVDITSGTLINEVTNKVIMDVKLPSTTTLYNRPQK